MSDSLENMNLKHYLTFVSDGLDPIEIDEPSGFDGANFSIKQRDDGYGRDITFSGDDRAEYTFGTFENPLGHQFDRLLEARKRKGYEYICTYSLIDVDNGIDYVVGNIDFETADTNLFDYFKAIVVQDTKQALLKRKEDSKINQFSDEGLDGNPIEPIQTSSILIKPVPSIQKSKWVSILSEPRQFIMFAGGLVTNYCQNIIESEIDDTLTFFSNLETGIFKFPYLRAQEDLTNVKINIYDLFCEITQVQNNSGSLDLLVVVSDDNNVVYSSQVLDTIFEGQAFNSSYDLTIPLISSGQVLNIGIAKYGEGVIGNIGSMNIDIEAKKTSMPSVTKGCRLIDTINYTAKSICKDFEINAPRFELGGEHYNNFVFSGNMLRGRDKFVLSWKSIHNYLQGSPNCDYEINGNENFIGNDEDFYPNNEIGVFLISPNDDSTVIYNERFTNNGFNFRYKNFDQDKDSENTLDVVHSEVEFNIANDQVKNTKDIDIEFIRDGFLGESTRSKAVTESSTSLTEDDKVFIYETVSIAPSTKLNASRFLNHFVNSDGNLQMLNNTDFNWSLLGFNVGDSFEILNTVNIGVYTVLELTNTIITLGGNTPTTIGSIITQFEYPLTNVQYTIRTNEGFDLVEGAESPDEYPNLYYTPKRDILNNWSRFLSTCSAYNDEVLKCTYFKNAPEEGFNLRTQLTGGDIITENSDIQRSELKDALLTPNLFKTTVLCSFVEWIELSKKIRGERGFVRVYDLNNKMIKLYIKDCDYSLEDGKLRINEGEEKFESQVTTIEFVNGVYIINEVGYSQDLLPNLEYKANGDYIQFFDANTRPLTNRLRFDFVSLNGIEYSTIIELITAINELG